MNLFFYFTLILKLSINFSLCFISKQKNSKTIETSKESTLSAESSKINNYLKFVESIVDLAIDKHQIGSVTNERYTRKSVSENLFFMISFIDNKICTLH